MSSCPACSSSTWSSPGTNNRRRRVQRYARAASAPGRGRSRTSPSRSAATDCGRPGHPRSRPTTSRATVAHIGLDTAEWVHTAHQAGSLVFADVGWDPSEAWSPALLEQLACCHAFLPNDVEAMRYTRTDTPEAALSRLAELVPIAVITRGGEGVLAVDGTTGETAAVPALPVDVLDATGAGDVFGAGFVAATLTGWPLVERLRFACL